MSDKADSAAFREAFEKATDGSAPYPYQVELATRSKAVPELLNIPTGLGTTAASELTRRSRPRLAVKRRHDPLPRPRVNERLIWLSQPSRREPGRSGSPRAVLP
jgi:hypothetical protein